MFAPLDEPGDAPADIDLVATGHSVSLPSNGSLAPVSLSPRAVYRALGALRLGRFDVVHVHEPFSPGLPYGLLVRSDLPPVVATFHRSGSSFFYSALRPLTKALANRRLALRCAVSEAARKTAYDAVGGEYVVVFNGVEVDRYGKAEPWPTNGPTVLFLGRHEDRKGLRVLLEAFARLLGDRSGGSMQEQAESGAGISSASGGPGDIGSARSGTGSVASAPTLWIAGDGPDTDRLRRLYPESDHIHWLGLLSEEEKFRRLAGADVLCAPSLGGESFGMVLLEAMAARTLVVASDISGYRDAAGGSALMVPPGDPVALSKALRTILEPADGAMASHRERCRVDGAARAESWSMDRLAERYESLYLSTMQQQGR